MLAENNAMFDSIFAGQSLCHDDPKSPKAAPGSELGHLWLTTA
jgi:hypothetical protein